MYRSALWLALFLLLAGLFLIRETGQPWMTSLDTCFYDILVQQDHVMARRPAVVLVGIDDRSLQRESAWPWSPLDYAMFLKAVLPGSPGVIAIEPILSWKDDTSYQAILERYLLQTHKLLLSAELSTVREDAESDPVKLPILTRVYGNLAALPEYAAIHEVPLPAFAERSVLGAMALQADRDQRIRRIPMVMRYRGDAIPSFTLQALMLWLKLVPEDIELHVGEFIRLGDKLDLPIDAAGNLLLNPQSYQKIERVGFDDLLLASEEKETGVTPQLDVKSFGNKVVILGRTDSKSRVYTLANRQHVSRAEVLATAMATIQQHGFFHPLAFRGQFAIVLGIVLYSILSWRLQCSTIIWFALILSAAYALITSIVFSTQHLLFPAVLPYGLLIIFLIIRLPAGDTHLPKAARPS